MPGPSRLRRREERHAWRTQTGRCAGVDSFDAILELGGRALAATMQRAEEHLAAVTGQSVCRSPSTLTPP